jgi:hypothetical protein
MGPHTERILLNLVCNPGQKVLYERWKKKRHVIHYNYRLLLTTCDILISIVISTDLDGEELVYYHHFCLGN